MWLLVVKSLCHHSCTCGLLFFNLNLFQFLTIIRRFHISITFIHTTCLKRTLKKNWLHMARHSLTAVCICWPPTLIFFFFFLMWYISPLFTSFEFSSVYVCCCCCCLVTCVFSSHFGRTLLPCVLSTIIHHHENTLQIPIPVSKFSNLYLII